jgi:hypothetical protein
LGRKLIKVLLVIISIFLIAAGLVILSSGSKVKYNEQLSFKTKDRIDVSCRLTLGFSAEKNFKDEIIRKKGKVISFTKGYLEKLTFSELRKGTVLNRALASQGYFTNVNSLFSHVRIKRVYLINLSVAAAPARAEERAASNQNRGADEPRRSAAPASGNETWK